METYWTDSNESVPVYVADTVTSFVPAARPNVTPAAFAAATRTVFIPPPPTKVWPVVVGTNKSLPDVPTIVLTELGIWCAVMLLMLVVLPSSIPCKSANWLPSTTPH